jgi:hypothetical protein
MPANEYFGRIYLQNRAHAARIFAWVATNVGYPNIHSFYSKAIIQWVLGTHIVAINIAIYASHGLKGSKLLYHFNIAHVACVPNFVAVFKILKHLRVEVAVGVGYKAYSGHGIF